MFLHRRGLFISGCYGTSVVVALESLKLGVQFLILAKVSLYAGKPIAEHLVGVQVRVNI